MLQTFWSVNIFFSLSRNINQIAKCANATVTVYEQDIKDMKNIRSRGSGNGKTKVANVKIN